MLLNTKALYLLEGLAQRGVEIIIPSAVRQELAGAGRNIHNPNFTVVSPTSPTSDASLGPGEAEAIALCLEYGPESALLVTDDKAAGKKARRLGIKSTGTLGLAVLAAKHGVVTTDEALKLIKKKEYIWVTDDVEKEAIEKLRLRDP
ncbi:hypothetical protein CGL51_00220 [Pyrobaculum aerophilum]|uniref:DUF3368 domain-containing protein n=1 Tax=Pyrobaculum aerophilum TaxID=13773 RepID=A0A371R3Y2_9CREN|nr:hypothetical protein CGL51_00220 [Pyrobaculum aerophilum]RFA99993.1 hypothetical protein CGL52_02185 [Pyrobaculum aerophilum]